MTQDNGFDFKQESPKSMLEFQLGSALNRAATNQDDYTPEDWIYIQTAIQQWSTKYWDEMIAEAEANE